MTSTLSTSTKGTPVVRARGELELVGVSKAYNTRKTDALAVDGFSLKVEPGQFVTLLGPSGCGKTTTLRMIAGFETPTEGDILVDGVSITQVAPNRRPMSMVFQSYALFPHLSVSDNVGFGLTTKHAPKAERIERVQKVMELMGIEQYAQRYPHELSGGQQQRVALARAVVMEPSILLFDEPLSNLDAKRRVRMREEIRSIQQRLGITSVFVTHDQSEALTMSDLVVVMRDGRIEQVGTPDEIYHRPHTSFVASFLGTANFLAVEVIDVLRGTPLRATVSIAGRKVDIGCDDRAVPGASAQALIRSENLHVAADSSSPTAIPGTVVFSAFDGAIIRYTVDTEFGRLQGQSSGTETRLEAGTAVSCEFDSSDVWLICE
jgi:ABC-type Fe3+/spermidine/putrescine transport system ATPase subunit